MGGGGGGGCAFNSQSKDRDLNHCHFDVWRFEACRGSGSSIGSYYCRSLIQTRSVFAFESRVNFIFKD